jgi:hypothetical protein
VLVLICDVHSFSTVQALSNTGGAKATDLESTENKWKHRMRKRDKRNKQEYWHNFSLSRRFRWLFLRILSWSVFSYTYCYHIEIRTNVPLGYIIMTSSKPSNYLLCHIWYVLRLDTANTNVMVFSLTTPG